MVNNMVDSLTFILAFWPCILPFACASIWFIMQHIVNIETFATILARWTRTGVLWKRICLGFNFSLWVIVTLLAVSPCRSRRTNTFVAILGIGIVVTHPSAAFNVEFFARVFVLHVAFFAIEALVTDTHVAVWASGSRATASIGGAGRRQAWIVYKSQRQIIIKEYTVIIFAFRYRHTGVKPYCCNVYVVTAFICDVVWKVISQKYCCYYHK